MTHIYERKKTEKTKNKKQKKTKNKNRKTTVDIVRSNISS